MNVIVKPKEAVLDPQGNAVRDAMRLSNPVIEDYELQKSDVRSQKSAGEKSKSKRKSAK